MFPSKGSVVLVPTPGFFRHLPPCHWTQGGNFRQIFRHHRILPMELCRLSAMLSLLHQIPDNKPLCMMFTSQTLHPDSLLMSSLEDNPCPIFAASGYANHPTNVPPVHRPPPMPQRFSSPLPTQFLTGKQHNTPFSAHDCNWI